MGEFDLFNFLYALSSFCVGGAAMLGTFLALVSIFPVQKIDDNEKLLGQRLNELLTISFRTVDSYDELVEVRSQLMNVAKSYKQIFDEWGFQKESYHNLINMAQNITVAIQSLVIIAISCFIVAVSKATDLLFLALLSAAFLIGIAIKFERKYNRHSFFYKITAIRQRFLKNVFFQRDQIQYPLPEKLFYPCYFKNIKLRNQLPSSGEKLDIISIRAFSQITFIRIHGNKEKVAGDSQLHLTKYYIDSMEFAKKYGIQSYICFYIPNSIKMNSDLQITVYCVKSQSKNRVFQIKKSEIEKFYKEKDYYELVLRSTVLPEKIEKVMVNLVDEKVTFWYKREYIEQANFLSCAHMGWTDGTYYDMFNFNYVDSISLYEDKE